MTDDEIPKLLRVDPERPWPPPPPAPSRDDHGEFDRLRAEYEADMHAVQSGILLGQATPGHMDDPKRDDFPKYLRTGITSAHVTDLAIARLLIDKGIITELEYFRALREAARRERADYEARLGVKLG